MRSRTHESAGTQQYGGTDVESARTPSGRIALAWNHGRHNPAVVGTLAATLVLAITVAGAYADGAFNAPFDPHFWRLRLLQPALFLYWLVAPALAARSHDDVVVSLRRISLRGDKELDAICAESRSAAAELRMRVSVVVGVIIGTAVSHPWTGLTDSAWAFATRWALDVLVWGLISGFVVETLVRVRLASWLHRAPLSLDLFDLTPLTPVARWGLSIVWVIAGAGTIAAAGILDPLIFTEYWIPIVAIYLTMTLTTICLFFCAMWPSHRLIVTLKQRELDDVRRQLVETHSGLRANQAAGHVPSTTESVASAAAWITLERRLHEISEWPYNTAVLRNLAVTLLLPTAAAIARAYFGLR